MVEALREGMATTIASQGLGRARDFYSPGRLLYYEKRYKALEAGSGVSGERDPRGSTGSRKPGDKSQLKGAAVFVPRWMDNAELAVEGLVVGARMFKMQ